MKNAIRRLCMLLTLCMLPTLTTYALEDEIVWRDDVPKKTAVRVDFSNFTGVPLLKRQNVFSPSHSFVGSYMAEFMRDVPLLSEIHSESQRIDLFMGNGGVGSTLGKGTPENLSYSWMQIDMTLKNFYKGGVMPYLVYFATPNALFDKERGPAAPWKYPPIDYDAWLEVCAEIAEHYVRRSWPLAAHELWNEPDWGDEFYDGTWEEYLKIYEYGATGVRQGNPYAMVGGLSLATFDKYYSNGNVRTFLDYVQEKQLPLDFISYHCYVTSNYPTYTNLANASLAAYGDTFATTGLHLNEFHVSLNSDTTATEKCIGPMMDAILYTLEHPQITSVNWACFRVSSENGIQMIDSRSGKRYAAYHLLSFYNRMPVDRVALETSSSLKGVASIDGQQAGVMLYNRTYKAQDYVLQLDNLPWETCDITVYAIDKEHSNYGRNGGSDEPAIIMSMQGAKTEDLCIQGNLPSNGLIYAEITESGHAVILNPVSTIDSQEQVLQGGIATVQRREYYFEDRDSTMFSEFDLRSFTAWAGMGNREKGLTKGAAILSNLPDKLTAYPSLNHVAAEGASIYLTVEYLKEGQVVQTQHYMDAELNLNGVLILTTPEGFDGEMKLSWGMKDAGADTTLKIVFEKE